MAFWGRCVSSNSLAGIVGIIQLDSATGPPAVRKTLESSEPSLSNIELDQAIPITFLVETFGHSCLFT